MTIRGRYVFRLYVAGMTQRSTEAIANLGALCRQYLAGHYDLEVIDVRKNPELARKEQLLATPVLVKTLPLPVQRFIGNLADEQKILAGLDLLPDDGTRP